MKGLESSINWSFPQIAEVASAIANEKKSIHIIPRLLAFAQTSPIIDASWCSQYWIKSNLEKVDPNLKPPPKTFSKTRKIVSVSQPYEKGKLTKKGEAWFKKSNFRSAVILPICVNKNVYAQIVFFSLKAPHFPEDILSVLSHLAEITALAVSKTWLFRERKAIHEFSQNMAHAISADDAIQTTLRLLTETLSLNHSVILIPSNETHVQIIQYQEKAQLLRLKPEQGLHLTHTPLILNKDSEDIDAFMPFEFTAITDGLNFEQLFVLPLFGQKSIKGSICLTHGSTDREFSAEEIDFAKLVTDLLNTTLENLSLFDELIRRAQELISLNQISEKISGTLNNQELAQIVYGEISNLTSCQIFLLALVETGNRFIEPLLLVESGQERQIDLIPMQENSGFFWAIHDLETILIEGHDPLIQSVWEMVEFYIDDNAQPQNCILSPMAHGTIGYGVMLLFSEPGKPFTPDDIQIVRAVTHQAALGLANSALLQAEQNHVSELRSLSNVTRAMATGITSQERITGMIRTLHTSLRRGNISILMVDSGGALSIVGYQGDAPRLPKQGQFARSLIGRALLHQTTQFHPDLRMVPAQDKLGSEHVKCQISVPIMIGGEIAGVLNADHPEANIFTDNDLRLLQSVSLSLGSMLENGRLFREIQDANKRLKALDQLKTRFLANMSHELRTPLNSIIGFSRIMMKGMNGSVTKDQYVDLESIYNSGQHLLSLINDILDLAKLEAGKMGLVFDDIDLEELANSVIATARGLVHDQDVELIIDIHPDARFIEADNIRLRQVLLNLLSNASKFTKEGTITLASRPGDTADTIIVSVEDTGVGIDPVSLPRIFDIFEQGRNAMHPETAGTGLGLSIVRELVNLHNGRVLVESELGEGSAFHILIPRSQPLHSVEEDIGPNLEGPKLADEKAYQANGMRGLENPMPSFPKAILLVDDDPAIAKLYRRFLDSYPIELICVSNGVDAISMLENHQYEIILIIMDIHMPEISGWETVRQINAKELAGNIPIAISSVEPDFGRASREGVDLVLPKPVNSNDLESLFKRINLPVA